MAPNVGCVTRLIEQVGIESERRARAGVAEDAAYCVCSSCPGLSVEIASRFAAEPRCGQEPGAEASHRGVEERGYGVGRGDGIGVRSADRILPECQHAQVGDIFPMAPKAKDMFAVRMIEPGRALVLGDATGGMSLAFVLEPVDENSTRLITRSRAACGRLALGLLLRVFWHPVDFGMQRRQLLNLKRLVEATA